MISEGMHLEERGKELGVSLPIPLNNNTVTVKLTRKIALGAIIQARQEMPLVELQLKRHRIGESGDFVSTEGQSQLAEVSISGKLPSNYYQEVLICETCFLVYKIINDARQKALRKIEINSSFSSTAALSSSSSQSPGQKHATKRVISTSPSSSSVTMKKGKERRGDINNNAPIGITIDTDHTDHSSLLSAVEVNGLLIVLNIEDTGV